MVQKIDHIGILVSDLAEQCAIYEELGMEIGTVEKNEGFGVDIAFIPVGGTLVELIEPLSEESELWPDLAAVEDDAFLHHVAYRVADIDQRLADLKDRGIPLADEEARPGGVGARIAFIDSSAFGGVAVELVERDGGDLTFD